MHPEAYAYVAEWAHGVSGHEFLRIVELGGRNVNGSVRELFPGATYVSVDVVPGAGVDVVADARTYRPDVAPDLVVCCEVLEHSRQANLVVQNALEMLRPGGTLLVTCAGPHRGPHSAATGGKLREGEYYRNVDPAVLYDWVVWAGVEVELVRVEYERALGDVRLLVVKGV